MADVDWVARILAVIGAGSGIGGLFVSLRLLVRDGYRVRLDLSYDDTRALTIRVRNSGGIDVEVDRLEMSEGGGKWVVVPVFGPDLSCVVPARRSCSWHLDVIAFRRAFPTREAGAVFARARVWLSTGRTVTTRSAAVG